MLASCASSCYIDSMNYKEVMNRAVATKLVLDPTVRLIWKRQPTAEDESVYSANHGQHIIDHQFGNLIVLNDGEVIIEGAPTVDAAKAAADVFLALEAM